MGKRMPSERRRPSLNRAIDCSVPSASPKKRVEIKRLYTAPRPDDASRLGVSEPTLRLYRACKANDVAEVRRAIHDGGDLEWHGFDKGRPPLTVTASQPQNPHAASEIIHALLDANADIAGETSAMGSSQPRQTALYRATVYGVAGECDPVLMALLGRGADWKMAARGGRELNCQLCERARHIEDIRLCAVTPPCVDGPTKRSSGKVTKLDLIKPMREGGNRVRLPPLVRKNSACAA